MATPLRRIKVMLSSRNVDLVPDGTTVARLDTIRRELQDELHKERFCGQQLLEVWINEEAGAEDGTGDAWDQCMKQVDQADIVVVIYNGHAGWARDAGSLGICHAELERAWSRSPSKLRFIRLDFPSNRALKLTGPADVAPQSPANRRFADFIDSTNLFRGPAADRLSLKSAVKLAVAKGVADLVNAGSREGRKGRFHLGSPLDWSRLTYTQRKQQLETVAANYLREARGAADEADGLSLDLGSARVFSRVHGVPAGFGTAEARELVGRPYLLDHELSLVRGQDRLIGPLHFIACHKACTESQVVSFMGHPDLFIVQAPFGFFVADQHNFVQTFFLTGCRDESATLLAFQRVFDWIGQSGEAARIVERAQSRTRIIKAMAKEISKAGRI